MRDGYRIALAAVLFATASGALSALVPLMMLTDGRPPGLVGLVVILAGLSQLVMRVFTPRLMRFMPDRALVLAACLLLAVAGVLATGSSDVAMLAVVQLLHGMARAQFWTGLQTHSVRSGRAAVQGLATVNLSAGLGLMAGPAVVALILQRADFTAAMVACLLAALLGAASSFLITRLPPFEPRRGAISRTAWTAETMLGSWMSAVAGGWKGVSDVYVPVLLVAQAYSESSTSLLVAVSNGAILLGSVAAALVIGVAASRVYVLGVCVTAAAAIAVGLLGHLLAAAVLALVAGGTASGLLQTVGPAIAAESTAKDDQGDAIAMTGIFRSSGMLGVPGLMTLAVAALPVGSVFALTGGGILGALVPVRLRKKG